MIIKTYLNGCGTSLERTFKEQQSVKDIDVGISTPVFQTERRVVEIHPLSILLIVIDEVEASVRVGEETVFERRCDSFHDRRSDEF